ncbi:MFS transporter [Zavarzinella formosa]|uniref:MFS transporter n=1 Tax=Zavarzinella formosa TaxID=360055 RepID=UPI000317ED87|nr:MFS transporter [Zavarzinella formosa]
MSSPVAPLKPYQVWLVVIVASIGFLFDTYELLMFPVIARPAIMELAQLPEQSAEIPGWIGRINWLTALSGGIFGLMGGLFIDRFGRKKIMVASIMLYSFSPVFAAFSTSLWMLIVFRCTTFIGVCVEFVAAITWLSELFTEKRSRQLAVGWTQAFASVGGLLVTAVAGYVITHLDQFPALPMGGEQGTKTAWRYTLLTGMIPGLMIALMLPFVPESRIWAERKRNGTLIRPRLSELFTKDLRRTTLVTACLSACAYGAAFGALQLTPPQIVPGLPEFAAPRAEIMKEGKQLEAKLENKDQLPPEEVKDLTKQVGANKGKLKELQKQTQQKGSEVQLWQELGGLLGRIALAILVVVIIKHRLLLRIFQFPGLIIFPVTYMLFFRDQPELFPMGIALAGFCTVAQLSYFGEFLPKVFPTHLRGTGGSFATNVGGRMIGTSAGFVTTSVVAPMMAGDNNFAKVSMAAGIVGASVCVIGLIASCFLPEPKAEE